MKNNSFSTLIRNYRRDVRFLRCSLRAARLNHLARFLKHAAKKALDRALQP